MADVQQVKKKVPFKRFSFRGYDLDKILDMTQKEVVRLYRSRQRRRFSRGIERQASTLVKKLLKAKRECAYGEKPKTVNTHLRNMIVMPEMIGSVVGVYQGKQFINVEVKPEMIGYYLGEFSLTYKPTSHGKPGVGATNSSRYIPLK